MKKTRFDLRTISGKIAICKDYLEKRRTEQNCKQVEEGNAITTKRLVSSIGKTNNQYYPNDIYYFLYNAFLNKSKIEVECLKRFIQTTIQYSPINACRISDLANYLGEDTSIAYWWKYGWNKKDLYSIILIQLSNDKWCLHINEPHTVEVVTFGGVFRDRVTYFKFNPDGSVYMLKYTENNGRDILEDLFAAYRYKDTSGIFNPITRTVSFISNQYLLVVKKKVYALKRLMRI